MESSENNRSGRVRQPPLDWQPLDTFTQGAVQAEVTVAQGRHGELFSYRVSRIQGDRQSHFFRPDDLADHEAVLRKVGTAILARRTNGKA